MATRRKTKARAGRGAPGKAKSAAHRAALSKALKAYHAGKKGKKSTRKRSTGVKTRKASSTKRRNIAWSSRSSSDKKKAVSRAKKYYAYQRRTGRSVGKSRR